MRAPGARLTAHAHAQLLKATFKARRGLVFSATEFKFPKFHMLLHFKDLVLEFGSIDICDTARWETFHQYTKEIYARASGWLCAL